MKKKQFFKNLESTGNIMFPGLPRGASLILLHLLLISLTEMTDENNV